MVDFVPLILRLKKYLPEEHILLRDEQRVPYECDGLTLFKQKPGLVLLPDTVAQVQQILKDAHELDIPVIARGAGTGLSGGATPREDAVLLVLSRFNRILEIDEENLLARVQPGVRNLAVSEAVADLNVFYAPDPSSQIACSVGGNVAENSGGVHCLKYGLTVNNVVALKVVTIQGEVLEIGSAAPDAPGYDLLALMHGSEGLLGVVVEVLVKLTPKPQAIQVLLAAFDDVGKAGQAVANIIAEGIIPAGLEMMDKPAIQAAEAFAHAGYPLDAEAILICELDGSDSEVEAEAKAVTQVLTASGATTVRTAGNAAERQLFWAGRKSAFPAVGRLSPDYYCMDGTIPRKHLAAVLQGIRRLSEHYGLAVANVFHAGDGNLHPLILFDSEQPGDKQKAEAFGGNILELCVQHGGTITGEHGVGIEKINQMCIQFQSAELQQFHALKSAFDAKGLLNPGKAIPTLHRCAEFGAMHVHHGEMPHPEIERF